MAKMTIISYFFNT